MAACALVSGRTLVPRLFCPSIFTFPFSQFLSNESLVALVMYDEARRPEIYNQKKARDDPKRGIAQLSN